MLTFSWLIPLLPLLSFIILILFQKRLAKSAYLIGSGLTFISFVMSVFVLTEFLQTDQTSFKTNIPWYSIGDFNLNVGYEINALNALMLVIVSLVSLLIQVYSKSYMGEDVRIHTYYAYLGLFTFSMLGLVISPNLLQLYIFWELVGLGSFLLIGYYYRKESAKQAAKKAFLMTRIGDIGFLLGMILLFWQTGSFELADIFAKISSPGISSEILTASAILIFIGAVGKSAQFPLHTWLPDAMEGPTPVSALIHAATMVAAGVYLMAALYPLITLSETTLTLITIIGITTAFLAATMAMAQTDIKRVLAYSTVSQLGFMMLALGTFSYVAAIFHLLTHAFFKALLFLAAGSVIHGTGTQNINEMGNLKTLMPKTRIVFLIGTMAISGVPLLSGFFSKDEILMSVYGNGNHILFWVAIFTSFLTAMYMFRLYFKVFGGKFQGTSEQNVFESPNTMLIPMYVLAFLAIVIGYVNTHWFGTFLGDWLLAGQTFHEVSTKGLDWVLYFGAGASLLGILFAYLLYSKNLGGDHPFETNFPPIYSTFHHGYYIDSLYHWTFIKGTDLLGKPLQLIDRYIIEGIIEVIQWITTRGSKYLAKLHNGQTQFYAFFVVIGLVILLTLSLWTGGYF